MKDVFFGPSIDKILEKELHVKCIVSYLLRKKSRPADTL